MLTAPYRLEIQYAGGALNHCSDILCHGNSGLAASDEAAQ
jgi:hypothetical protein